MASTTSMRPENASARICAADRKIDSRNFRALSVEKCHALSRRAMNACVHRLSNYFLPERRRFRIARVPIANIMKTSK